MEVLNNNYSPQASGGRSYAAPAAKSGAPSAESSQQAVARQVASLGPQQLQDALSRIDLPEVADGTARVELNFNQDTGRVVAKVTDRSSGEILREIPSKELQQLFSQMREYLGNVVDEEI
ncbi:flagellar protein FlaG [Thalassospira sp. MA62]|nr:flagellar protein FlaG [Thalassospira sp. MA62]